VNWENSIKSWFITIFLGSILSQIFSVPIIISNREKWIDYFVGYGLVWTLITFAVSLILSVPTLFILHGLSQKYRRLKKLEFRKKMIIAQLICGSITFCFVFMYIGVVSFTLAYAIAFIGTGIIIWDKKIKKTGPNNE